MKRRKPRQFTDVDGDLWTMDEEGDLVNEESSFLYATVERKWGPLTPFKPSLWERMTASWRGRLTIVALTICVIAGSIGAFFTAANGGNVLLAFFGPFIIIAMLVSLVFTMNSVFVWVFPQLKD